MVTHGDKLRGKLSFKIISLQYHSSFPWLLFSLALSFICLSALMVLFFHNDFNRKHPACCSLFFSCLPIPFNSSFFFSSFPFYSFRLFLFSITPLLHNIFLVSCLLLTHLSFVSHTCLSFSSHLPPIPSIFSVLYRAACHFGGTSKLYFQSSILIGGWKDFKIWYSLRPTTSFGQPSLFFGTCVGR